jgi:hypothetical protein
MLWSSASGLWLGLVDPLFWLMLVEVSAETFPGWYSVAFGFQPLAYLAWVCHSRVRFSLAGVVDSTPPFQDSLTLGWLWPRSRVGESACVLRASDLSSRGVHIPPEVRYRPGQGRRACPGLGGIGF